jgi:predicted MFS family arabinose efflux permease
LGVPYILRAVFLGVTLVAALFLMKDLGFKPDPGKGPLERVRQVLRASLDNGLRNPPARWLMLAAPFTMGVGMFAFYALQPYLLQLYGNEGAFGIAGLAAAIVAGCEMVGGIIAPRVRRLFSRRSHALMLAAAIGAVALAGIGWTSSFWVAIALLVSWQLGDSAARPMRQAFLNGVIPSGQRATVLSFDNLMGSAGGVVAQPALGRVADVVGYGPAYLVGAVLQAAALPFLALARRQDAPADRIDD